MMPYSRAALGLVLSLLLSGCSRDSPPGVSDNLAQLRAVIELQVPTKSARWEVFGTPEYKGGVPGPTDFVTLIAELELEKTWINQGMALTGHTYIAPEAARPWLSDGFRIMLEENRNTTSDLSSKANCRKFNTTLKKSARPVEGFACESAGKILVYLTLQQNT